MLARRRFTQWTIESSYSSPIPGEGDVKYFAGTFPYTLAPQMPAFNFCGFGSGIVKGMLSPETGRWQIVTLTLDDPPALLQ